MNGANCPWDIFRGDPRITDLVFNGATRAFVDRGAGLEPWTAAATSFADESALKLWVLDQCSRAGKTWDARHPFIDATARAGGDLSIRLHAIFPPVAPERILLSLRRLPGSRIGDPRTESLVQARARWAGPGFDLCLESLLRGDCLIISGGTGAGKTTLLNDLLSHCPETERVLALEDTSELSPAHPHFLSLLSRAANSDGFGEVTLRTLLRQALRMRPDRIVLGECRGEEVLDLLQALNTGHQGALATLHANTPRDALRRLELLTLIASRGGLSSPLARELIATGIKRVVQVTRTAGGRRITEVAQIEGREGDTILMRPLLHPWGSCKPPERSNISSG